MTTTPDNAIAFITLALPTEQGTTEAQQFEIGQAALDLAEEDPAGAVTALGAIVLALLADLSQATGHTTQALWQERTLAFAVTEESTP